MTYRKVNISLFVTLVISLGLNWTIRMDRSRPNYYFLPEMVSSIPYNAFAANPNFSDGKTLQRPVPGTVPQGRDYLPLHYEATPEDARRAGEELHNPFSADSLEDLQRGALVYETFCRPCHGVSGAGDGPVSQRGFPPPPSLANEKALGVKDGQIFHIITYGQGNMPAYASQISRDDRWKAILHVRSLQDRALIVAKENPSP